MTSTANIDEINENQVKKKKKPLRLSLTTKKALSGWLFVLPFVLGILFLYGPIIIQSIRLTFSDINLVNGLSFNFIGIENYKYAFEKDEWFWSTVANGLKDLLIQIPAIVIFSLFMAIILNQDMKGRTIFRAIFFLPVILGVGIIDSIDTQSAFLEAMNSASGAIDDGTGLVQSGGFLTALDIQNMLGTVKVGSGLVDYVFKLINSIFDIVSRSGVQMLIFLSGLQSISPAIYESCQIEGATAWETFWKITLPMISPMILVNSIFTVIDAFTASSNRVMGYISGKIYRPGTYEEATAEYWMYLIIVLGIIILVALILKAFVFYQKRD